MKIRSFAHKGLKALYMEGTHKGVPPEAAEKLRHMFAFLDDMAEESELLTLPVWRAHRLKGSRSETWSLSVTANRRLTFEVDERKGEISDIDLEDYH